ncbi:hypothetical protein A5663_16025 [Mycobacterium sp. E740]|nr:hypothetical protein A5663_16025 [Mycobacterium sp. E740]
MAAVPVELFDTCADADTPADEALDGASSELAAAVAGDVLAVDLSVDELDEVVSPVEAVDEAPLADESESAGSAHATSGAAAIAIPTPNATANPPTRPM